MISKDLQSTYYSAGAAPFFVDYATNTLSMISYTNNIPSLAASRVCHVQYHLSNTDNKLYTYVVANNSASNNWNITFPYGSGTTYDATVYRNSGANWDSGGVTACFLNPSGTTWADTTSTGEYISPIIPCVVGFYTTNYGQTSTTSTNVAALCSNDPTNNYAGTGTSPYYESTAAKDGTAYPYAVQITLQLMSRPNYAVWKTLPAGAPQDNYKAQHALNFSKMVTIGNRGQYE